MKKLSVGIAAIAAGFISVAAQAYAPGDIILRAGAATVDPESHSDDVKINGTKVDGLDVRADSNTQLGLTGTYIVAPHFGIGLLAATPFEHDVKLHDDTGSEKFGTIKHLPPTLTAQYFFMDAHSKFQPYVGFGLNYTVIYDEKLSSDAKAAGFSNLKLDNSFGLALEAGFDYAIDEHWLLNAAIWKLDINSTGTADVAGGAAKVKVDYELDPWVYMIGVGYKF